jgi:hypothetical protein
LLIPARDAVKNPQLTAFFYELEAKPVNFDRLQEPIMALESKPLGERRFETAGRQKTRATVSVASAEAIVDSEIFRFL